MKKRLCVILGLFLCAAVVIFFVLWGDSSSKGDVSRVEIDYGDSQFFTEREMEQAAEALVDEFQAEFPDYTLTKLWYVNDLRQLENDGDVQYDGRNIIFYSDMEPKSENQPQTETLTRYRWCVAVNDAGRWYVVEHGF